MRHECDSVCKLPTVMYVIFNYNSTESQKQQINADLTLIQYGHLKILFFFLIVDFRGAKLKCFSLISVTKKGTLIFVLLLIGI